MCALRALSLCTVCIVKWQMLFKIFKKKKKHFPRLGIVYCCTIHRIGNFPFDNWTHSLHSFSLSLASCLCLLRIFILLHLICCIAHCYVVYINSVKIHEWWCVRRDSEENFQSSREMHSVSVYTEVLLALFDFQLLQ